MVRVFQMSELKVVADNAPGTLAQVVEPITKANINIGAFCTASLGDRAQFLFITADNERAKQCLADAGFETTERQVVVVETTNERGVLYQAAQQFAKAGVDLEYSYATSGNVGTTWIVFATKMVDQALGAVP